MILACISSERKGRWVFWTSSSGTRLMVIPEKESGRNLAHCAGLSSNMSFARDAVNVNPSVTTEESELEGIEPPLLRRGVRDVVHAPEYVLQRRSL